MAKLKLALKVFVTVAVVIAALWMLGSARADLTHKPPYRSPWGGLVPETADYHQGAP